MAGDEFADFLRSRRERLSPALAGLAGGGRRRTPGLRRGEVAALAGIGVDWYVRLEQGRAVRPSAATVDALAGALRLDAVEHAHLRALAGGGTGRAFVREQVPATVRQVVESLTQPAYVTGRRWDILAWNDAAREVFGDFGQMPDAERNILLHVLTHPDARRLFGAGWAEEARRMVAQFRAVYDLWAADPAFRDLHARLRAGCAEFGRWWDAHEVRGGGTGIKTLHHPVLGPLRMTYATFQANDDPALRLAIYLPVDAAKGPSA